jgi:hypothetical protein
LIDGGYVQVNEYLEADQKWLPIDQGYLYLQKDYEPKAYFCRFFEEDEPQVPKIQSQLKKRFISRNFGFFK